MTMDTETIKFAQKRAFEKFYQNTNLEKWAFHTTPDRLVRYTRDRRLKKALRHLIENGGLDPAQCDAFVVCGGTGGEGVLLANYGFRSVTVSDIAEQPLTFCRMLDNRLQTVVMNAESLDLPDSSVDVVVVQDGLHHLPRPSLGLTEMLRVARKAVIVIEPYQGMISSLIGAAWEEMEGEVNFVFRWNKWFFRQVCNSYALRSLHRIDVFRLWDHHVILRRVGSWFPKSLGVPAVKLIYGILDGAFRWMGNMMIAVVLKNTSRSRT